MSAVNRARLRRLFFAVLAADIVLGAIILSGSGLSIHAVLSGSMRPTIQPGDLVIAQRVRASALHVGDVIGFLPPDDAAPRVHRIVMTGSDEEGLIFQTKGDANQNPDAVQVRLRSADRVIYTIPLLGFLWAGRATLWLVLGLIGLILVLVEVCLSVVRFYRHRSIKRERTHHA